MPAARQRARWTARLSSALPIFERPEMSRVEVEHRPGLVEEVRVAGEDPRALLPGFDRVLRQPAPDRRRRRFADGLLDDEAVQLSAREARQRDAAGRSHAIALT